VNVGDELPPLEIPITATRIVAGAIASRDFMPVHHDPSFARDAGAKDVFMNILTTNGYVARFVTDWAGPDARLRRLSTRLGAPNYPGDTMTLTGRVTAIRDGEAEIEIRGANGLGDHVTGTVVVALP
jgi:acyl dehydratase